jgi:DNA-nicking Smr family endonuclease
MAREREGRQPNKTLTRADAATPGTDDFHDFAREMADVTPLDPNARERVAPVGDAKKPPVRRGEDAEVYARLADLVGGRGTFDIGDTGEFVCGLAPGIDRRLLRRLRQGDYAVQGHLDLHGYREVEAKVLVDEFIRAAHLAQKRCVLIVHGRGHHSKDHVPVLKERLVRWLSEGRIGAQVLAFASARPHDGGAGAVYVLLRK